MSTDNYNRMGTVLWEVSETHELYVRLENGKPGRNLVIATREFYGPGRCLHGWLTLNADDLEQVGELFSMMFKTAIDTKLDGSEPIELRCELAPSREHGKPQQLRMLVFLRGGSRTIALRLYNKEGKNWSWANEDCVLDVGELYQIFETLKIGTMWNIGTAIYK